MEMLSFFLGKGVMYVQAFSKDMSIICGWVVAATNADVCTLNIRSAYETTTGLELLGHFRTGMLLVDARLSFTELCIEIKHFRLGIDSSREGLDPIPRRDCEQRTGSWNKRTEKCRRRWIWDSECILYGIFVASLAVFLYDLEFLTREMIKHDPFIPPEPAKLEKRNVLHTMGVDHCFDTVHTVLCFRHSSFSLGITWK